MNHENHEFIAQQEREQAMRRLNESMEKFIARLEQEHHQRLRKIRRVELTMIWSIVVAIALPLIVAAIWLWRMSHR